MSGCVGGDVVPLAGIFREVEQQRRVVLGARLALAVRAAGDEVRLVVALANRAQLAVPVVEEQAAAGSARCRVSGARRSTPSIVRSAGSSAPASLAAVTNRSIAEPISVTTAGRTVPGHQKIAGVRTPPSHVVPLPSRSGPADPPCVLNGSHGPLSLVKTTSVRLVDAGRAQRVEHAPGAPVDLLDDVAVDAAGAVPDELGRARERDVRQRVREVEEERPVAVGRR